MPLLQRAAALGHTAGASLVDSLLVLRGQQGRAYLATVAITTRAASSL